MADAESRTSLRALILEDSEFDARVLVTTLRQGGYDVKFLRVETAEAMRHALAEQTWDVILADYNMPTFDARAALEILQGAGLDIPLIIISGGIGEDIAVAAMKAGAYDYLMKGSLARLVPAVERELREAEVRRRRREAEHALRESELRYRTLWETSPDAVVFCDSHGIIAFANPAVQAVFGYEPSEMAGRAVGTLEPEATRGTLSRAFAAATEQVSRTAAQAPLEGRGLRKDGKEIIVEVTSSKIDLPDQRWFVLFIRDITEKRRAEEELRANEEQFRIAREIQQRLYPKHAPALDRFDIAGSTSPAAATGGDYFDFLPMVDGSLGLVVADVSGHGLGPALLMAETRAFLRILARNRVDPAEILARTNRVLAEDVDGERYVTVLFVRLDAHTGEVVHANAGHPAGLLLDASGSIKARLKRTGLPLGIQPDTNYNSAPASRLNPGDVLILYTDGIEEAMAPNGEFFGWERVVGVVRASAGQSAEKIIDALRTAVNEFTWPHAQEDDVTLIVVKAK